ncbi:MAG: hypothetical protein JXA60_03365 [Candidatus Coatesbacteria bacterium]|nr:hypothetical protein [Candidatus Coatesbacteria bacterium]
MKNDVYEIILNSKKPVLITGYDLDENFNLFWKEFCKFVKALPEKEISIENLFKDSPARIWEWFEPLRQKQLSTPLNPAYIQLKKLEDFFTRLVIITQDISSSHLKAGSEEVYELYGNFNQAFCSKDMCIYELPSIIENYPPVCDCGHFLKPNIFWFGGGMSEGILHKTFKAVNACDLLIFLGAKYVTQPLPYYIELARSNGARIIEISSRLTEFSNMADIQVLKNPSDFLLAIC